ncbi:uncharacterized protein LOC122560207 isoform X2 [Chiloscyllium plagiosum]|uniref:uncharacterized protein LOC122560207 isoform X2 n=1 Tax=Chiloscyllium plagiosum TaxID=36176 RepID=UPI001CB84826|nr:uncharacterized protein LOC122560207 isoform X2 [Chiloscyllium plagiosum]
MHRGGSQYHEVIMHFMQQPSAFSHNQSLMQKLGPVMVLVLGCRNSSEFSSPQLLLFCCSTDLPHSWVLECIAYKRQAVTERQREREREREKERREADHTEGQNQEFRRGNLHSNGCCSTAHLDTDELRCTGLQEATFSPPEKRITSSSLQDRDLQVLVDTLVESMVILLPANHQNKPLQQMESPDQKLLCGSMVCHVTKWKPANVTRGSMMFSALQKR